MSEALLKADAAHVFHSFTGIIHKQTGYTTTVVYLHQQKISLTQKKSDYDTQAKALIYKTCKRMFDKFSTGNFYLREQGTHKKQSNPVPSPPHKGRVRVGSNNS
jgi:hypothetical protein